MKTNFPSYMMCANLLTDSLGHLIPTDGPAALNVPADYRPVAYFRGLIVAVKGSTLAIIRRGVPAFTLELADVPEKIEVVGNRIYV